MPVRIEHTRRSIRLPSFDYASSGAYFVTIGAYQRECLFGEIVDGGMVLNEIGRIVRDGWDGIGEHFSNVKTDEFVVMPNHVHGVIWLDGSCPHVGATHASPLPKGPSSGSVGAIIGSFKSAVTKRVNEMNPLFGPVWQRNYYERVIRSDAELDAVRQYIRDNPAKWEEDPERK
ncbi:transposase [Candidatus Uhrbacteria bacterium]|nr:MAG: transposase [Candidatus Uhrbacteria bacterium]